MSPGEVVGERFEVERMARSGGMGAVFRARDRLTGEAVALKVLLGAGGRYDARFLVEAQVLAKLRHPSIVRYVAHGRTPAGQLWLAMEWLDGEDLAERIARGRPGIEASVAIAARAAEALGAAHARGVV